MRVLALLQLLVLQVVCEGLGELHCNGRSMRDIAKEMVKYSSPVNSTSWLKTRTILTSSKQFHVMLQVPIFLGFFPTLQNFLSGTDIDLKLVNFKEYLPSHQNYIIENGYFGGVKNMSVCRDLPDSRCSRIIIQSEQLNSYRGEEMKAYLLKCHLSPTCVVWDFSSFNLEWAKKHGMDSSFVLLPVMNQFRFTKTKPPVLVPNFASRPYDVVFYGLMVSRRNDIMWRIKKHRSSWRTDIKQSFEVKEQMQVYSTAKVCLTMHAFSTKSGGEYHRLSESSLFGCVQVMEKFTDTVAIDIYEQCAGVVFAPYDQLVNTIARVLDDIKNNSDLWTRRQNQVVDWWVQSQQWANGFFVSEFL